MSDLTLKETANILKLSYFTVYDHVRKGKLPGYQIGRLWRVNQEELNKFRKGQYTGVVSQAAVQPEENKEWQFSNVVKLTTFDLNSKDKAYTEALERARSKRRLS